jgi:hypothetical protein
MVEPLQSYDVATALLWGADCVEHLAHRVNGVKLLGPSETRYEAGQFATADLRAMQVALMRATKALCGADPLTAGREAARAQPARPGQSDQERRRS